MALRVIWQYMNRSITKKNIIWTEAYIQCNCFILFCFAFLLFYWMMYHSLPAPILELLMSVYKKTKQRYIVLNLTTQFNGRQNTMTQ